MPALSPLAVADSTVNERKIASFDELVGILSERRRRPGRSLFLWRNVDDHVHRELLYAVAKELNLSNPRLIASKFLEKRRFKFLNDLPLNGLYSYYKNRIPRKKGVHLLTYVCDLLGIPDVDTEDWVHYIRNYNIYSWGNIPVPVKREILFRACRELGYSHPILMNYDDFAKQFKFLNNKTLTGFYNYFNTQSDGVRGIVIKNICDALGIEITEADWIAYITGDSTNTFWNVIPPATIRSLLFKAAAVLGYTNPRMMSTDDLKVNMDFLGGLSFYSFASRFFSVDTNGVRTIDYICNLYEVPELTFEEWLCLAANQNNFRWERFPLEYLGKVLEMKAAESGKENPRLLKYEDFASPCGFLNQKNLTGLYNYCAQLKADTKDTKIDTVSFICDLAGIPQLTLKQWLTGIETTDNKISWESLSNDFLKEVLWMAARELGLKNPRLMGYNEFHITRFAFLKGKTLSGLYANFAARLSGTESDQKAVLQTIFDTAGIERLTMSDWFWFIGNTPIVRWENVPSRIQRELVLRASSELGLSHPRLMKTKDFTSVPFRFINGKTLSGLYYHYGERLTGGEKQINEYLLDRLNIPKIEINPKTGRISTIDNLSHRNYFHSLANFKSFVNAYLREFSLESLCRKYTMIRNAKKAGLYRKGLVTVIAPMKRKEYIDFLYNILKNTPRDLLNLRKPRNGDYRLLKSDLYKIAGLTETPEEENRIEFAAPDRVEKKDPRDVLDELSAYREILAIKEKYFHQINCEYLTFAKGTAVFGLPVPFSPGDILTTLDGEEFEVTECRARTAKEGYIVELQPLSPIAVEKIPEIRVLIKDSNEAILGTYLEGLMEAVRKNTLSPLLAVVLGLRKERQLTRGDIKVLPTEAYFNKALTKNTAQRQAVNLACALDGVNNTLAIIQGPPGTGKTTLIKEIALQYYKDKKNVLILAKTNVAVDNILEKLVHEKVRVLRSGNNLHLKSALPYVHNVSTANALHMAALAGRNKITLGTPLGFHLDRNLPPEKYEIVIIDEASQMDIPETLFALGFAEKCVMIGDHLQIPPFPIPNEVLAEYNPQLSLADREEFQKSLFEKLITDRDRFNSVFLDINYRTQHPKMVSFISDLIYDTRLAPNLDTDYYRVPQAKRRKLYPAQVIEVMDTSDITEPSLRMETEINSTFYNLTEAMLAVKKVLNLLESGEKLDDICIITPYKAQVEKIKEVFLEHSRYFPYSENTLKGFIEQQIYTVDSFQGREQEIVIISWVRSNYDQPGSPTKTGFLKDFRRMNVALSRAKRRLILIGDFATLTRSENATVRYIFNKIYHMKNEEMIVL